MVKFRSYVVIICTATALILPGCAEISAPLTSLPPTVTIGAVLGLSGNAAAQGLSQKNGIELAVKEINSSNYLGKPIEFKVAIEDAGTSVDGVLTAMNALINDHEAIGIIGPTLAAQLSALGSLAQENGIPLIDISDAVPVVSETGDFVFRCSMPEAAIIDAVVKAAFDLYSLKTAGIIWQNDNDYTVNAYQSFRESLIKNGIDITFDNSYTGGTDNFGETLAGIGTIQPDALIIAAFTREAASIIVQARTLNFKNIFIGSSGLNTPDIISMAGKHAEGVIAGTPWNVASTAPRNLAFISAYEKTYGSKPDQFAAHAYTATWLYARAIRIAGSVNLEDIRNALADIRDFDTPLGSFSFTEERNPNYPSAVRIIRDGVFVTLDKETAFIKSDVPPGSTTEHDSTHP